MHVDSVQINRAPVLTLWIAVVARRTGHPWDSALTIGKMFAGLNAQAKGRALGIFTQRAGPPGAPPKKAGLGEEYWIHVAGRAIPMKSLGEGPRAVVKDKPIDPESVTTYLARAFGDALEPVKEAMEQLADSYGDADIESVAFALYEKFRPKIESGQRGWGQKGTLDLVLIRRMAEKHG
jgi:hypothetical protein